MPFSAPQALGNAFDGEYAKIAAMGLTLLALVDLVIAAAWALMGTNAQAGLARDALLSDLDSEIALAARLWRPGPRWLHRKAIRKERGVVEQHLREGDPARAQRYSRLCRELYAWNALESAVAMGLGGSVLALVAVLVNR